MTCVSVLFTFLFSAWNEVDTCSTVVPSIHHFVKHTLNSCESDTVPDCVVGGRRFSGKA